VLQVVLQRFIGWLEDFELWPRQDFERLPIQEICQRMDMVQTRRLSNMGEFECRAQSSCIAHIPQRWPDVETMLGRSADTHTQIVSAMAFVVDSAGIIISFQDTAGQEW